MTNLEKTASQKPQHFHLAEAISRSWINWRGLANCASP